MFSSNPWLSRLTATGRWLIGRALYFVAIVAIAVPVLFLRSGFTSRAGSLPGFDGSRFWKVLQVYLSHLRNGQFGPLYTLSSGQVVRVPSGASIDAMIARALPNSLVIFGGALLLGTLGGILLGLLVSRFAPRRAVRADQLRAVDRL